jgi:hypothetical protein
MRRFLLGLGALLVLLVLAGTSMVATQTPAVHAALMQQIARSGLAQDQDVEFENGWLSAHSQGRIQLAASLCASCQALDYQGTIHHGLGAWLVGDLALASAHYQISMPELPIEPALPPLNIRAQQRLDRVLMAHIMMPASAHRYRSGPAHSFLMAQGGIGGSLKPDQLNLELPALSLSRDEFLWFTASSVSMQAAAEQSLRITGEAQILQIPEWDWIGQHLQLSYKQAHIKDDLSFDLNLNLAKGRIGQQAEHPPAQAALQVENLNLVATQAFMQELPRLMADSTPAAARMLGLFSLYSVHGPDFFSSEPALALHMEALPLTQGSAEVQIQIRVTPGTRRPPMHPLEWRRALQGRVDIRAPRWQLKVWWQNVSAFITPITGLPRSYAELLNRGWATTEADGRDRLYFELDPLSGPRRPG